MIERLDDNGKPAAEGPPAAAGSEGGPTGLRTRREAVWLGIRYFTVAAATSCTVGFLVAILAHAGEFSAKCFSLGWWTQIGVSLTVSLPVAALTGAVSGHEHYRRAAGQKHLWAGIALLLGLAVPFPITGSPASWAVFVGIGIFWWIHCTSRSTLNGDFLQQYDHGPMTALGLVLLVGCCIVCGFLKLRKMDGSLAACSYCSLFLSDSLVVRRIGEWRRKGLIEQRPHKFQFSLATMLIFCVALGAYALMVATFFLPRR